MCQLLQLSEAIFCPLHRQTYSISHRQTYSTSHRQTYSKFCTV